MQKLIFCGYLIPQEETGCYKGVSIAGNKMQWNIIKNLAKSDLYDIECLTISPLASFPKQKVFYQNREKVELIDNVYVTKIPYINLPVVKQYLQIKATTNSLCRLLSKYPDAIILSFNLFPQIGVPLRKIKKKFPKCNIVSILADLPIDDNTHRKGFSKILRKRFDNSTWKSIQLCDNFIVLNEYVAKTYFPKKNYLVIDGGVAEEDIQEFVVNLKKEKNILFSGALTEYNGIIPLLQAMEIISNKDIKLDIYGGGYLEEYVLNFAKNHSNVIFHGKVNNKEMLQRQRDAWLLINPRIENNLISKVTFPSKTFEYMLSGTPILSTRLNGYSEEYFDKMYFIEECSAVGIAKAIDGILELDEQQLIYTAKKAYDFVVEKRTWKKQTEKIIEFLTVINDDDANK